PPILGRRPGRPGEPPLSLAPDRDRPGLDAGPDRGVPGAGRRPVFRQRPAARCSPAQRAAGRRGRPARGSCSAGCQPSGSLALLIHVHHLFFLAISLPPLGGLCPVRAVLPALAALAPGRVVPLPGRGSPERRRVIPAGAGGLAAALGGPARTALPDDLGLCL